jgi:hypothetical protein
MIRYYAFSLSFLLVSLLAGPATSLDQLAAAHPSQDGRCRGDTGSGDTDRSEKACLAQLAGIVTRQGDTLRLTLKNGSSKVYTNRSASACEQEEFGDCAYKLTGYFPRHGLILIQVGFYEGIEWILVRLDSGKEARMVAPPYYSSHQKWLVSVCWSDGPAGCPNGIDIIPTVPDQADREWHYQVPANDYTLYEFVSWDGDERVKLAVTFRVGEEMKKFPASVDRIDGRWRLKLPKEHRSVVRTKP